MRRLVTGSILIAVLGLSALEAQTIFIARHAERTGEPDPPLNEEGQRRAEALARLLTDAGVYYFYSSDTLRARQTAEPLARRANRPVEAVPQAECDQLIARIRKTAHPERPTLVIGHRQSVPRIVKALGGGDIPELRSDEHDRLIVLTMLPGGRASALTLRYAP
ncbi:MAG: phosphoglycerate mutase family protein [Bryobacteraceae bacterium]